MNELAICLNQLEKQVLGLWNQGMMPEDIAGKLNLNQDYIEDVIETENNYPEKTRQRVGQWPQ